LTAIEALAVSDLDQPALEHLSQLKTLRSLEIERPRFDNILPSSPEDVPFGRLAKLKLGRVKPKTLAQLLGPFISSPLLSLDISVKAKHLIDPDIYRIRAPSLCSTLMSTHLHASPTYLFRYTDTE
jgi:hypothetical protein